MPRLKLDGCVAEGDRDLSQKHPSGWESPKAAVTLKTSKTEVAQSADGRIPVEPKAGRELQIDLNPGNRSVAALEIELLPDPKNGNRILRAELRRRRRSP